VQGHNGNVVKEEMQASKVIISSSAAVSNRSLLVSELVASNTGMETVSVAPPAGGWYRTLPTLML
jgi:hypothetical protein